MANVTDLLVQLEACAGVLTPDVTFWLDDVLSVAQEKRLGELAAAASRCSCCGEEAGALRGVVQWTLDFGQAVRRLVRVLLVCGRCAAARETTRVLAMPVCETQAQVLAWLARVNGGDVDSAQESYNLAYAVGMLAREVPGFRTVGADGAAWTDESELVVSAEEKAAKHKHKKKKKKRKKRKQ